MELTFLGTGSAFNTKAGNTSAYFIDAHVLYLFDCGSSIFEEIKEQNLLSDINEINVFITHTHGDHIGSLSTLIEYCYYVLKIPIYLICSDTRIVDILSGMHIKDNMYEYYDKHVYTFDKYFIGIFDVEHDGEKASSFSVEILNDGITIDKLFYSGDTKSVSSIAVETAKKGYNVYHECSVGSSVHTSIYELRDKIEKKYRKHVYLMHLDSTELKDIAIDMGFNVIS